MDDLVLFAPRDRLLRSASRKPKPLLLAWVTDCRFNAVRSVFPSEVSLWTQSCPSNVFSSS